MYLLFLGTKQPKLLFTFAIEFTGLPGIDGKV